MNNQEVIFAIKNRSHDLSNVGVDVLSIREVVDGLNLDDIQWLTKTSLGWQKVAGNSAGTKEIVSKLYQRNAHYLSELLQNAEDAEATEVEFELRSGKLIFRHNGRKLFDKYDLISIIRIGKSTKTDDPTKVGEHGIGFKAVYAFTDSPRVYSRDFCFEIKEMLSFSLISKPADYDNRYTTFEFPFDCEGMNPDAVCGKIERELRSFRAEELLFLENIKSVSYTLPEGEIGILQMLPETKAKNADGSDWSIVHLSSTIEESRTEQDSYWIKFSRSYNTDTKKRQLGIAYNVKKQGEMAFSFEAVNGQVCIMFPADSEKSNLKFHINAPFASQVTRETITKDEYGNASAENQALIKSLAGLAADSIKIMRDAGLLNETFYALIPIGSDEVDKVYADIASSLYNVFLTEEVYLTLDGQYVGKEKALSSNEETRKWFGINDIQELTDREGIAFLKNPLGRGITVIRQLGVEEFNSQEIFRSLCNAETEKVDAFFSGRTNEWYKGVYAFLSAFSNNYNGELREAKIVRASTNQMVRPRDARFETKELKMPRELYVVNRAVFGAEGDASWKFLHSIGVETITEKEVQELREEKKLKKVKAEIQELIYSNEPVAAARRVLAYLHSDNVHYHYYDFSDVSFVYTTDKKFAIPRECYLDAPYFDTGFARAESIHRRHGINACYKKSLTEIELSEFIDLLKKLDVFHRFYIVAMPITNNKDYYHMYCTFERRTIHEGTDWGIENLDSYLALHDKSINLQIWQTIMSERKMGYAEEQERLKKNSSIAFLKCQKNEYGYITGKSQLALKLWESAWLPTTDGEFKRPCDVEKDEFDRDFVVDNDSPFVEAIELFKKEEERALENERNRWVEEAEYKSRTEAAKQLGFSSYEEAECAREKAQKYDEYEKLGLLPDQKRKTNFAVKPSGGERRSNKIKSETESASSKKYEYVQSSTRILESGIKSEIKTNLREYYTNDDGQLVCQVCHEEMPFKKKNGAYYFEAIELDKSKGERYFKETPYHYLACCPTCAAMFDEYISHSKNSGEEVDRIISAIKNHEMMVDNDGNESIMITLAGRDYELKFVQKHIEDIRSSMIEID